ADALVLLPGRQRPGREDADTGGDQDRLRPDEQAGVGGDRHRAVVQPGELARAVPEQDRRVVGLGLLVQIGGELSAEDRRDAAYVVDDLLRVQRGELPAR